MTPDNPFLDTAFSVAWSRLTPEWVEPAIEEALSKAAGAVDAIAAHDVASLTFENTFLALENATEELNVAWSKVGHLQSVADSPALRAAHAAMLPKVSAFYARIPLNAALWERLRLFSESPAAKAVSGIRRRLLEETVKDFRQAGADLPAETRARLEAIQRELAEITQKFSDNVLDSTNAWQLVINDESRLAGLPDHARKTARRSAEAKGLGTPEKPAWRFTLHWPSMEPVLNYAEDDALRREVWTAATRIGAVAPHDNSSLIDRVLTLRSEKARLLGRSHFAELVLERRMAKTADRALEFIEDLRRRASGAFADECRELEDFKAAQTGGARAPLAPWEIAFYAERLRRQKHDLDEELLRPYFPMDRVIAGLFSLAERVFGLRFKERPTTADAAKAGQVEVWHPEVRFYEMHDAAGRHLGSFYADWHPREPKRGGAWMGYLITGGGTPGGGRAPHLGYICGNMTPPIDGRPALLTHRETETIFHEFGHLLHHLLGEVEIKSLNGVNVAWDFVELPSQLMENWCWERVSLDLFARHFETGNPIPEDLFKRMTRARNFRSACAIVRQVMFARLDLRIHVHADEFIGGDVETRARTLVEDCMIPTNPPAPTPIRRFTHIFADPVGYAAGYYSYKWAEVLDADAFSRFQKEGILDANVGARYVETILSRGNSEDPDVLFRAFMGRDPDIGALLRRCGLSPAAA